MLEEFKWSLKYRPTKVADTVLPESMKAKFQKFVDDGNIPDLILAGPPGIGKTTIAKAMLDELGCDYIVINGSMDGNIDTLRNTIKQFASSVSIFGSGRKYVILDEADYLNANSTQPALRNFMEEYSKNCGFILTCNFKNRLIEPLHSRCAVIDFKIRNSELPGLAAQIMKRVCNILETEDVEYEKAVVAEVVKKFHPDWRRVINELQNYAGTGKIDSGILIDLQEVSIKGLMKNLKNKEFSNMRKWVAENIDAGSTVFRSIYDQAALYLEPSSIPPVILIIGKYQYQHAFVADPEINLAACLTEIMIEGEFK